MLLIDASVYIFRAFHSLPSSIKGRGGRPLNAVHGYTTFLTGLLADCEPSQVAAAFDESLTSSFRNEWYADYKANRELPPEDLVAQISACRDITEALGVATLSSPRYEADDLMGSLAAHSTQPVTLVTSDKDLAQLLGEQDVLWDYAKDVRFDRAGIQDKFGVWPEQIPDYLALVGDTVDNIPGIPGIGAKTAAALLSHAPDLESLLASPDAVASWPVRGARSLAAKLGDYAEQARLSRRLAVIVTDVPLSAAERDIQRRAPDRSRLAFLCDELGAGNRLRERLGVEPA